MTYPKPDWSYVSSMLNNLQWEMQGFHTKIKELEELRYYEEPNQLNPGERVTGRRVRVGLTEELCENVKAAVLSNRPRVRVIGTRKNQNVGANQSKREQFWQRKLDKSTAPVNLLAEVVDAQLLGMGVFKSAFYPECWDKDQRERKAGEDNEDYLDRVTGLKKLWGPPIADLSVHPMSCHFRPGVGNRIEEMIEHSYLPKNTVKSMYSNVSESALNTALKIEDLIPALPGKPTEFIRPLPVGVDTSHYCLVTQYTCDDHYVAFVNGQEVYSESPSPVRYFLAPGRASSSKDPDKYAMSIAENLRHNEPVINMLLTRMLEAQELIVNKRLTLEVPETYVPEINPESGADGTNKPKQWTFTDDAADALPPGAKVVDPYKDVQGAFAAMPMVEVLMSIAAQHGVSPLFKGISPGAAGSGYRDNSLYLMAKSQFNYLIESLQACLTNWIAWQEWLLVNKIKETIYIDELELSPSDISDWPSVIEVILKPELPQNVIAEGQFWESMRQVGNVSRRFVREHGLGIEQPDQMGREVVFEQSQEQLLPYMFMDVVQTVFGRTPGPAQNQIVGPDGNPISSQRPQGDHSTSTNGRMGQEVAGRATGGQPRQPAIEPAGTIPMNRENR